MEYLATQELAKAVRKSVKKADLFLLRGIILLGIISAPLFLTGNYNFLILGSAICIMTFTHIVPYIRLLRKYNGLVNSISFEQKDMLLDTTLVRFFFGLLRLNPRQIKVEFEDANPVQVRNNFLYVSYEIHLYSIKTVRFQYFIAGEFFDQGAIERLAINAGPLREK